MIEIAGLNMYQASRTHVEQAHSPQGHDGVPCRPGRNSIELSSNEWIEGPNGLISLGDMLCMAGFPVESQEDAPPPPPSGPVPLDYMDPPPPPSP
eukprot:10829661-Karenia_brevis.AAC.1